MTRRASVLVLVATALLTALTSACGGGGAPGDAVLAERARWSVEPTSWVATDGGDIVVNLRVSGPSRSSIERLSFRVELRDAGNQPLEAVWRTIDLTAIPQGAPKELAVRLPAPPDEVATLAVDTVLVPTAEERPFIEELRGS